MLNSYPELFYVGKVASWESVEFCRIVLDRIKEARANNAATKGREVRS